MRLLSTVTEDKILPQSCPHIPPHKVKWNQVYLGGLRFYKRAWEIVQGLQHKFFERTLLNLQAQFLNAKHSLAYRDGVSVSGEGVQVRAYLTSLTWMTRSWPPLTWYTLWRLKL